MPNITESKKYYRIKKLTQEDLVESLVPVSPSLHRSTTPPAILPAGGLITPEVIRPYPIVDRTESKKSRKGKQQGKSRIYTDTPEKIRLEEIEKAKQLKKQEQEIKQKAKEMKRAFNSTKDEGSVNLTDVVHILTPSKSALTARTSHIYSFEKDLSVYAVG